MDIQLDKKSPIEGSIKVTLKQDDYQPQVEEKVREYARKANVKGFRPGKVPPGMIKKMYGTSIKVEEVNNLLSKSLTNYIKENDLKILGDPLPDKEKAKDIDWDSQADFTFEYHVGLVDDFQYEISDKTKVNRYKIEADKKAVDETVENLKKQFGKHVHPEEVTENDTLDVEVTQKGNEINGEGKIQLEGFDKKQQKPFIGVKKGDSVEVDLIKIYSDDAELAALLNISAEEVKGLKGKFEVKVTEIHRTEPAELNQELFDNTFGKGVVEDEKAFRDKIKTTIEENYNRESEYLLERDIRKHLINETDVKTPDDFLKNWLVETNEGKLTREQVEEHYEEYLTDMKWDLISSRIAEDNEIKVEHSDVMDKAKAMIIEQLGGPAMAEQLKDNLDTFANNYLQGQDGKNYMQVYNQVMFEKIMAFVKEKITIKDKKVDVEEFKKQASKQ